MENLETHEATDSLHAMIETLLFASPKALTPNDILELLGDESLSFKKIKTSILEIEAVHKERKDSGFHLEEVGAGQYQFRTKPQYSYVAEKLFSKRPRPLSRAAQETLAIVAYRQPVSRADIEFIRGTDSGSILKNLLDRDFVKCVGRKDIPGKPMLFGTTEEFLRVYHLASLKELPSLESFQPRKETLKAQELTSETEQGEKPVLYEGEDMDKELKVSEAKLEEDEIQENANKEDETQKSKEEL